MISDRTVLDQKIKDSWDFDDPDASARLFAQRARESADPVLAAIWRTQQARAAGLVGHFDQGHQLLDQIAAGASADRDLSARICLERGRLFRSAGDPIPAREQFERAVQLTEPSSDTAPLGGLEIDALHMLALLETEPEQQIQATRKALERAEASHDPTARAWRASLWNNLGCAQVDAGDPQAALHSFQQALALREHAGVRRPIQIARWMVGWALRLTGQFDQARALQRALKAELDADGIDDQYVMEELALLDPTD